MSLQDVPRCQHVKVNGTQCGSPALRRRRHCYFHNRMLDGKKRFTAESQMKPRPLFSMGLLEDANSLQLAIMQVLSLLGCGQMDPKTASLMLRGLRIASLNLRFTNFEANSPTDVVIDRNSVSETWITGQQWYADDFEAAEEGEEEDEELSEETGEDHSREEDAEDPAESAPVPLEDPVDSNVALVAKHLQAEAARMDDREETRQTVERTRKKMHSVISNYVLNAVRTASAATRDKPN
jgi:hypothetical protein